jgi:hypothetical protein
MTNWILQEPLILQRLQPQNDFDLTLALYGPTFNLPPPTSNDFSMKPPKHYS